MNSVRIETQYASQSEFKTSEQLCSEFGAVVTCVTDKSASVEVESPDKFIQSLRHAGIFAEIEN